MAGAGDFISGYIIAFGLLLAVGPQVLFILRQGLRRENVLTICGICFVSEAILICVGVSFAAMMRDISPMVDPAMKVAGAVFLAICGAKAALPVIVSLATTAPALASGAPVAMLSNAQTRGAAVMTCMALTWLNPHVYLETVVLIGPMATAYAYPWVFAVGAMIGAGSFYFAVGLGARLIAPWFEAPAAWQRLDLTMGLIMIGLSAALFMSLGAEFHLLP